MLIMNMDRILSCFLVGVPLIGFKMHTREALCTHDQFCYDAILKLSSALKNVEDTLAKTKFGWVI